MLAEFLRVVESDIYILRSDFGFLLFLGASFVKLVAMTKKAPDRALLASLDLFNQKTLFCCEVFGGIQAIGA